MILAIDVHYEGDVAYAAGIIFSKWDSTKLDNEVTSTINGVADYTPGNFYKRELPCIVALLKEHNLEPDTIIVDGYVYLDENETPGLGKHLSNLVGPDIEVVGVAKSFYRGMLDSNNEVCRGNSIKPLYVTTTGDLCEAKANVFSMDGKNRSPTLLKRADTLCRQQSENKV